MIYTLGAQPCPHEMIMAGTCYGEGQATGFEHCLDCGWWELSASVTPETALAIHGIIDQHRAWFRQTVESAWWEDPAYMRRVLEGTNA
jgi:hypothetical protein